MDNEPARKGVEAEECREPIDYASGWSETWSSTLISRENPRRDSRLNESAKQAKHGIKDKHQTNSGKSVKADFSQKIR